MNRAFVMLAQEYDPKKHHIAGWLASEKLDGTRAIWDGGVTRGLLAEEVPWANLEKNARYVNRTYATGMWSRLGNVIHAPGWLLDQLPNYPLDGELFAGRGKMQFVRSTVSRLEPGHEWSLIRYCVFDSPHYARLFADGRVNEPHYKKDFQGFADWYASRAEFQPIFLSFESTISYLQRNLFGSRNIELITQHRLPFGTDDAIDRLGELFRMVTEESGEGLVLRKHTSIWEPRRTANCLKYKPERDDEAVVIGYTSGRRTDKGSKLLGKMGALIVQYGAVVFELSGFTDAERDMQDDAARTWGEENPGKKFPPEFTNPRFPIGSIVTFKYRELTDAGIPKEAVYYRPRGIE